jgi:hypothetical protein
MLRRSGRIHKEVPILLIGNDADGKVFCEETKTVVLSRHGAGVVSQHKLPAEQELILRCAETNKEAEIRVVGEVGEESGTFTYGIAFLDPNANFWNVEFPPPSPEDLQAGLMSLACSACGSRLTLDDSDLEIDVVAINNGVVRFCKRCGSSTFWTATHGIAPSESITEANSQPPAAFMSPATAHVPEHATAVLTLHPPEPTWPAIERRKHARLKVHYSACIRRFEFQNDEDIVTCEDMSRGGLCFKSSKRYYENSMIEVAVPYTPGELAIFVPAKIIRVQELAEQKLFCYGVAFQASTKSR